MSSGFRTSLRIVVATLLIAATGHAARATVEAKQAGGAWVLANGLLRVTCDPKDGAFTAEAGARKFVECGRTGDAADPVETVRAIDVKDTLGVGKALELQRKSGRTETIALYEGVPLVCVKATVKNAGAEPMTITTLTPLVATVNAGADKAALRAFGPEGPYPIKGDKSNYAFAAIAEPKSRAGVVCGWLTHHRASGIVTVKGGEGPLGLEARGEYGKWRLPPGQTLRTETAAIGWFDDALAGLETYASAVAKAHEIKLRDRVPSGYCTWYHAQALDEKRMAALAKFCQENLAKFGLDFLQIDDGWQIAGRDFSTFNPKGPYPSGMKPTADTIRAAGFVGGIWFIPFGWDPKRDIFKDHQDWFVHREDGKLYEVYWGGTCLDMTHPEARTFLRPVIARMTRDWGYKYIKIDGLWTGMAVKILYPQPTYRDDGLGDAVFHDPSKTNVEAYRDGLKLVREAAGDDVFILGCNIAQNMRTMGGSIGLVDGMRIGPDVGAEWPSLIGGVKPLSHMYFWHKKVWFNDPDCLMLRNPLTVDQTRAWGSVMALSGQMVVVSEWLPDLTPERMEVLKRTIPNHGGVGRPLDLFEKTMPQVWQLRADLGGERRDLVGLFNWNEKTPADVAVDLASLGLSADEYVGFDFWENQFVGPVSGTLKRNLRPSSCRIISLLRKADRPQLVSTSRHVTQGAVDVVSVEWDAATKTLRGRSRVVGGDPYELRLLAGDAAKPWKARAAEVGAEDTQAGVAAAMEQEGPQVRVKIAAPQNREVAWQVAFE